MSAVVPMLLGINGVKESGKNTAARFLEEWCGELFTARSQGLADALKVSAARSLGFNGTVEECIQFCNELKQPNVRVLVLETVTPDVSLEPPRQEVFTAVSGREFLQFYGTESHREVFGDSFWIDHLLPTDKGRLYAKWDQPDGELTQLMMVTDVRFPNEAERVKELGGLIIKIRRPEVEHGQDGHSSEKPLPAELIDEVVVNDSTPDDFRVKVCHFAQRRIFDGLKSGSGRWD